jgi:sortase A
MYNYRTGAKSQKKKKPVIAVVAMLLFVSGLYLGVNSLGAAVPASVMGESELVTETLTKRQPSLEENKLYVPKIGVDVAVVEGVDESSLEGGAWHREPQNGDPVTGGNFVLAAHRFNLGLTPTQTRAKSPFYHIDKMQVGDDIYVDYKGVRYAYKVSRLYKVDEKQVSIESRTNDSQLTMYSCDLGGPEQGREVVEAKPVGTIAWQNGQPKLRSTQ